MRYIKKYESNKNFNYIVEKIKSYLLEDESWEEFIDNQKMGDCQSIVNTINNLKIPGVVKHFGEIKILEPIDKIDFDKIMTHHWVTINGEIFEFSKGTLKEYVNWNSIYNCEDECEIEYSNNLVFESKIEKEFDFNQQPNKDDKIHSIVNRIYKKIFNQNNDYILTIPSTYYINSKKYNKEEILKLIEKLYELEEIYDDIYDSLIREIKDELFIDIVLKVSELYLNTFEISILINNTKDMIDCLYLISSTLKRFNYEVKSIPIEDSISNEFKKSKKIRIKFTTNGK